MNLSGFLQLYPARAPNIMWMLGAGASAAANVPTAGHMILDFKRRLYCAAQRVPLSTCANLSDPALGERLQQYFDSLGGFPPVGADDEYAAFFEAMYPDEADRRRYIEQQVLRATPSLGHVALAALLSMDRARAIWTTNFDRVLEDATAALFGTSARLTVATIDTANIAREAINEGRWPLLVKLHGDFQSRRLKNTTTELRAHEQVLEVSLTEACGRFGLAVVGYSGRDASVMRALEAALDQPGAFPNGLFWFHWGSGGPLNSVEHLIEQARAREVDAHILQSESFDELLSDVVLQFEDWPPDLRPRIDPRARRMSDAPRPPEGRGYPVIRLNALPVTTAPTTCRLVTCTIGGMKEVRAAVDAAGVELLFARRRAGILIFGPDASARRAFSAFGITAFDVHAITPGRLSYESAEQGLLTQAMARALARQRPVEAVRRRSRSILAINVARQEDPTLHPLVSAAGDLSGTVPDRTGDLPVRRWREAVAIRLDRRDERLWLLIEPTIWVDRDPGEPLDEASKDFVRERLARRYNAQVNALLDAWTAIVTGGVDEATLMAFGPVEGVDAVFTVQRTAAFSRRLSGGASGAALIERGDE